MDQWKKAIAKLNGFLGSQGAQVKQLGSLERIREEAASTFRLIDGGSIEDFVLLLEALGRDERRKRAYMHVALNYPRPSPLWPVGARARTRPAAATRKAIEFLRRGEAGRITTRRQVYATRAKGTINDPTMPCRVDQPIAVRNKQIKIEGLTRAFLKKNKRKPTQTLVDPRDHIPSPKPEKLKITRAKRNKLTFRAATAKMRAGESLSAEERKEVERRQRRKERRQRERAQKAEARGLDGGHRDSTRVPLERSEVRR